jgi:hypothetical protein
MIMAGTLIILALWLAFVWFVDPDGYRNARRAVSDRRDGPSSQKRFECTSAKSRRNNSGLTQGHKRGAAA